MQESTTIQGMMAGNRIFVPRYQRSYSWETPGTLSRKAPTHTGVFVSDLENHNRSAVETPYYFGHFLFEENINDEFGVIDGQQRLTTIVIFLSALFVRLQTIRELTESEDVLCEDMIKRKSMYRFSTVDYDDQLFRDYVIDRNKKDENALETESAKRIVKAFNYFTKLFEHKDEDYLVKMLKTVSRASCTTHQVKNESEAIQMFIFQNNRGKKPSDLEIIKAQFMFNVHLYGGDGERGVLIEEIKGRFENIYRSISSIEYKIDEDDVLIYTLRFHFNSLWEKNAVDRISKELSAQDPLAFIQKFSLDLEKSFAYLTRFFGEDQRNNMPLHSLITLGGFAIAVPFLIKAYSFGLEKEEIGKLCSTLEVIMLRDRLIGTRANLISRINNVYQAFTLNNRSIQPIAERVDEIKNTPNENWWLAHWNKNHLEDAICGGINHTTAKFLLWKYENYLENKGKKGYSLSRFDNICNPELEHIAPQTPTNGDPVAAGYCEYDEEFRNEYIDCLGNYLLVSASHNRSIGNKSFKEKRDSYDYLEQQREIQNTTKESEIWDKEKITKRHEKLVAFILENF